jgi:hypothetical protein
MLDAAEYKELELEMFEKPNFASPGFPQTTKATKKKAIKLGDYESLLADINLPLQSEGHVTKKAPLRLNDQSILDELDLL